MYFLIRWTIFWLIIFESYQKASLFIAIGFFLVFCILETGFRQITEIHQTLFQVLKKMEAIKSAVEELFETLQQHSDSAPFLLTYGDKSFSFARGKLSGRENELLMEASNGKIQALQEFLHLRSLDKSIDFAELPIIVQVAIAQKVIQVARESSTEQETEFQAETETDTNDEDSWPELIEDI